MQFITQLAYHIGAMKQYDGIPSFPKVIIDSKRFELDLKELCPRNFKQWFTEATETYEKSTILSQLKEDRTVLNTFIVNKNTRILMLFIDYLGSDFEQCIAPEEIFVLPNALDHEFYKCIMKHSSYRPENLLSSLLGTKYVRLFEGLKLLNSMFESGEFQYCSTKNPMENPEIPQKFVMKCLQDFLTLNHGLNPLKYQQELFLLFNHLLENEKKINDIVDKYKLCTLVMYDLDGNTFLHYIARSDNVDLMQRFLAQQENHLNHVNSFGKTPMNVAISHSKPKMIDFLQKVGGEYTVPTIINVPFEVLEYMCSYLNVDDVCTLKRVNKEFYEIADSESVTQMLTITKFGYTQQLCRESWKCVYFSLVNSLKLCRSGVSYYGPFSIKGYCNSEWRSKNPKEIVQDLILDSLIAPDVKTKSKYFNKPNTIVQEETYRSELLDSIRNFKKDQISPYKRPDLYWRKWLDVPNTKWKKLNEIPNRIIRLTGGTDFYKWSMKSFCWTLKDLKDWCSEKQGALPDHIQIWETPYGSDTFISMFVTDDLLQIYVI